MFIVTDDQCVVGLSRGLIWNVAKASKDDTLLIEITLTVPRLGLLLHCQVVEVAVAVHATRCKAHIIFEPVNGADLVGVAFADHVLRALLRVEVVNVDSAWPDSCREHVTTVRKSNFTTLF